MEKQTLFDKFFRDDNGNIVIAQPPNPPLILWSVALLLKLVFTSGLTNVRSIRLNRFWLIVYLGAA